MKDDAAASNRGLPSSQGMSVPAPSGVRRRSVASWVKLGIKVLETTVAKQPLART